MAILYLMCGCPGSGKSTWIENHLEEDHQLWISRDKIRFSLLEENDSYFSKETLVFNTFVKEIIEGREDGYDVFADATHISPSSRFKLYNRIPAHLRDETNVIWIKCDVTVSLSQNEYRKNTPYYVEPKVIRRMYDNFIAPSLDEGFDKIFIIEPKREMKIIKKG